MAKKENQVSKMPNQTIRLPQGDLDYIQRIGKGNSFNDSVRNVVSAVRSIEAHGVAGLMGVFEPNEWLFMLRAVEYDRTICDKNELIRQVADPRLTIGLSPLYGVDIKELQMKIRELDCAQVLALVERIDLYYSTDGVDEEEWANF